MLLAVETSHGQGSIALSDGATVLDARGLSAQRRHAAELLPAIVELMQSAGHHLRAVRVLAWSSGPGSFTGLRVAATLARMLQSATGCEVVAVPTLAVIAQNALEAPARSERLAVMLDARGQRVFGGLFALGGAVYETVQPAGVFEPAAWLAGLPRPVAVAGEGLRKYADLARGAGVELLPESCWAPRAEHVAMLGTRLAAAGRFCAPDEILPHYVRPPECEEVYEQRRAAARARRGE